MNKQYEIWDLLRKNGRDNKILQTDYNEIIILRSS